MRTKSGSTSMRCLGLILMLLSLWIVGIPKAHAASGNSNIKIVAWYGAGNLSKSEYARDTIILFNPTQAPITMQNWSLQSGGTSGAFTSVSYKLPVVTIPAGGFYAIAGSGKSYISSSGCVTAHCNLDYDYDYQLKTVEGTATATDNDLSSTAATIALVDNQTALGSGCPKTSPHLVDLVGIGASDGSSPVTCYAGSSYSFYTPSQLNGSATNINGVVYAYATIRRNRCSDSFDNATDFMLGFIDFANSKSTPQTCPTGTQLAITGSAAPNNPGILDPFTITAPLVSASSPSSTNLSVTADLSNLGLSATQPLYDDGTHGDTIAGDKVYSLSTAATTGTLGSVPGLILTATDTQGNVAHGALPLTLVAGTFSMTTNSTTASVTAGDVLLFPITLSGQHGYGGILSITCTGSPNTNSLGVPISTQCVSTPPEVSLQNNGTAKFSLAIATGTTHSAGVSGSGGVGIFLGCICVVAAAFNLRNKRRLPSLLLAMLATAVLLGGSSCSANAGLGNTSAAPGIYTYVVTATDSNVTTVTNSLTFTITVK